MPELPEVETVRRGLAPAMEGARGDKVEVRHRGLRWPIAKDFEKRIEGKTVDGLGRRAKYLTADLSSGDVLLMHLGMSGSFRIGNDAKPGVYYHEKAKSTAHDHVVFHMSNGKTITFNDPRRFGMMKIVPRTKIEDEPLLRGIGPEPLGNEFDAAMLAAACAGKKTSLKAALLDQRVVAGLGNIYAAEALWHARIPPTAPASSLSANDASRLLASIRKVIARATGARYTDESVNRLAVYDREGKPCRRCGTKVERIVQAGRSTYFCPRCQKTARTAKIGGKRRSRVAGAKSGSNER